ncbi:MAG: hypothetical protein AB7O38_08525 [Pirellulaceae bacterium]
MRRTLALAALLCWATQCVVAAESKYGLKEGTPDIQSAGPLGFGPDGILLVGDTQLAAIFAIDTGDKSGDPSGAKIQVENASEAIAGLLGVQPRDVMINDLVVNPASGNAYLSVSRGRGPDAAPVLLKVDSSGKFSEVSLKNVPFAKAALPNPPAPGGEGRNNRRAMAITDIAYVDGQVFIAGLSNEEFASNLRSIPFPFQKVDSGASVEIYHGAHGAYETRSPVRTFAPFTIKGEAHLLAAYTCTPLVKFRVAELKSGQKVKGTTIAELGNRNNPLDMIVYQKDGKDYLLIANTARGVMKVSTDNAADQTPITERVNGTLGLKYDTIADLKGVQQLDRLNDRMAVVLIQNEAGDQQIKTVPLP